MAFTGDEAEEFPLELAAKWTKNYREKNPKQPLAHFFGEKILKKILKQKDCVGLRIYYALDEKGEKQLIIVGTDKKENDIYNGVIAERSFMCPPFCGKGNPLNS